MILLELKILIGFLTVLLLGTHNVIRALNIITA